MGAALFGLGSLLFLAMLIARQPVLEMDANGVGSKMLWKRDFTPWENVAAVGYYRQTLGRGQYADYLIFAARDTSKLKRTWTRRLNSARYPEFSHAALTVALSFVFFRSTDIRRAQLLRRITDQFGPIIARRQIRIDTYLQQM